MGRKARIEFSVHTGAMTEASSRRWEFWFLGRVFLPVLVRRKPLTKLGPGEATHRWRQVLPGANAVLFAASSAATVQENANFEAISLKMVRSESCKTAVITAVFPFRLDDFCLSD